MTKTFPSPHDSRIALLAGPLDGQSVMDCHDPRGWILADPRTSRHTLAVGERALGLALVSLRRDYPGLSLMAQVQGVYRPMPGAPRVALFLDLAGPGGSPGQRRHRMLAYFTLAWYALTVLDERSFVERLCDIEALTQCWPEDLVVRVMVAEYLARLELLEESGQ